MKFWKTRIPFFPIWPEYVEFDGVKIAIRESPLGPRARRRIMNGYYEIPERTFVKRFVKPGDNVLELGASLGIVTSFILRQVGDASRVLCVEPNSQLRPFFDRQLALNGQDADVLNALVCPLWQTEVPPDVLEQKFQVSPNNLTGRATPINEGNVTSVPWHSLQTACENFSQRIYQNCKSY